MSLLWLFIPDEAMVLVIVLIGIGLMVGLLRLRSAGQLIGGIVLMLLLSTFIESVVSLLPAWADLLLLTMMVWVVIRGFFRMIVGTHAADHMVGILTADVMRGAFRGLLCMLAVPFRLAGWILRRV